MFLLRFKHKETGKKYLLYNSNAFVGGNTYESAEYASICNSAKAVSVGGFDIIEASVEMLAEMVGTTVEKPEFHIIHFSGGLIPFDGVEIVKELV